MLRRARAPFVAAIVAASFFQGGSTGLASTYRVLPGDTLTGIATAHRLTVLQLAHLNRLDPADILLAGAILRLPSLNSRAFARYRVRAGDTLTAIAASHRTSVATLARLNKLNPNGLLLIGRTLIIPAPNAGREGSQTGRIAIRALIRHWADHYRVPHTLALALAWQESGDRPGLTSAAGAWGVMQVIPATWAYTEAFLIGRPIPHTTSGGIRVGLAYLHHLLHAFAGNQRLALAAYLQGEHSAQEHGVLPSSRQYVANILALAR